MRRSVGILVLVTVLLAGSAAAMGIAVNVIEGSGNSASENRELSDFSEVHLKISANVTIMGGEEATCKITADDNILPVILTECSGKVLRISMKEGCYASRTPVMIAIEMPLLTSAEVNGSGEIDITGVTKDTLALMINGSGDITARGKVAELETAINGSGDLRATDLEAATVSVTVNGSGDADVHATDVLTARVHGSGDITYIGTPSEVDTSVIGSGDIVKK